MAESITAAELRQLIQEARSSASSHMLLAKPPARVTEGCASAHAADAPIEPSMHVSDALSQLAPGDDVDISPRAQLHQTLKDLAVLTDMLETGEELPHWAQAKLAKAAESVRAAKEYVQDSKEQETSYMNETQSAQLKAYVLKYINGQIQDSPDGANAFLNNIIKEEHSQISDKIVEDVDDIEESAFGVPTENDKQYECEPGEECEENRGGKTGTHGTSGNPAHTSV
tara:strand:+ start:1389 stop:2069 length:681 start_codon:yes stop_codon:yes gene_type:complete